jgi:divalent metal cation (Fe/Co/Zn/Cd) transporter
MSAEAVVSLSTAWMAHSPALLAFGGDSAIELLSAIVVYCRFRSTLQERSERLAARITGGLLFALAAYVALIATLALFGHREARQVFWASLYWPWQPLSCHYSHGRSADSPR